MHSPSAHTNVFIVIVNWNGREVTLDCLRSLKKLTYREFTIIVVDNASSDGSVESLRSKFPDIIVLEQSNNLRFAGGNNVGIKYAMEHGAEAVLLLNNDTTVHPEFLTHLVERLEGDHATGMVAPKIYYHDDKNRIWFAGGEISFWTGTMKHTGIRKTDRGQHDQHRKIDYATGCCVLVRSSVIEKVGMLDESYFIYTEDADWSMRVSNAGYSILYEPAAKVWHKLSVSAGGHLSSFKIKNKFISNMRFFARYASWYHWLVFPWMSVVANGMAALKYFLRAR
ncbi:MAG TPA: glycosyltransferase family 2 protein [Bacteroidota bacterium]